MEQTILTKVQRFVELSAKFSKSESDVFPNDRTTSNTINFASGPYINPSGTYSSALHVSGNFVLNGKEIFVDNDGSVRAKDMKPLTRGEKIEAEAKIKAILSDEFDEYNKLRYDLGEYFRAINKLNN
jgi:hypothetical protein